MISIIIPAYNEERTIIPVLERVRTAYLTHHGTRLKREIIVVDDGSTDATAEKLARYCATHRGIRCVRIAHGGKGSALRAGIRAAQGSIILFHDADLEYNPADHQRLVAPVLEGKAAVVYGSRFARQPFWSRQRWAIPLHYLGNTFLSLATSLLYGTWLSDMETGAKCFRSDIIKRLTLVSTDFTIEPEITAKILTRNITILEVPVSYRARTYRQGKKITWHHGIRALGALFKYKFF